MASADISTKSQVFASMIEVRRPICLQGVDADVTVQSEAFDPAKCEAEDIAENCSILSDIDAACKARSLADPSPPESAIYVIAPHDENVCKIGVAASPAPRLAHLQVGCWKRLDIWALFWVMEGSAYGIEKLAHRISEQMGNKLSGEWIGIDPAGAAYIVGSVVHSLANVKIADSAMWVRHRRALLERRAVLAPAPDRAPNGWAHRMELEPSLSASVERERRRFRVGG